MLAVATLGKAELMEIKNENTITYIEERNKEADDDLFVEFVNGKTQETSDKNIKLVPQTNIKIKKNTIKAKIPAKSIVVLNIK